MGPDTRMSLYVCPLCVGSTRCRHWQLQGVLKVDEDVVLAKRGVEVTFPQLLLDDKNEEVGRPVACGMRGVAYTS